jgi:uncharacterized protein (DUF697 family)
MEAIMDEHVEGKPTATETEALRIVNSYMGWSAGAGFVPIPLVDLAAISGVQLKMVHSLTKFYGVPFSREAAKSVIAALIGGGGTLVLATPASSLLKFIPVVGSVAGVLTQPALAAASTYALGKVFIQHFETGGNLLNFNASELRRHYSEEFAAARQAQSSAEKAG